MITFELPNYLIKDIIGQNAHKIVYRAIDLTENKDVVIKTLAEDYPSIKDQASLEHEYKLIKKLEIPLAEKVYNLIKHKGREYLILEYIEGITLKSFIREKTKLDLNTFYNIAIQLTQILEQIHQNKIIHKDFNSTNLIIHPTTLKVKLIDFSLSSELSSEVPSSFLEGTLAYISPEQTGRTNRTVDFRTDFYSLGVTFYEMVTGALPFQSDDPLQLIYYHLTKKPPGIPRVPTMLEKLVWKLLSKNAEDRYASAAGIRADLLRLEKGERQFSLGEKDHERVFLLSQKLYGREEQIGEILSHFEDFMKRGESELFLVKGKSGMGKTVLIQEVQKPLVANRGLFVKGKYDVLQKGVPFLGLAQAVKEIIQNFLKDENLAALKSELFEKIGTTGRSIADIVPELELILDNLPPLEVQPPKESLARLQSTFQRFFSVIAKKERPLVIFLDDLQGADQASLNLIQYLLASNKYLFFIGAYREDEVSSVHPLMITLNEIPNKQTLSLPPLTLDQIEQFVQDTLRRSDLRKLAQQIYQKTSGNPFFVTEFLKALYRQGLLYFEEGRWQYNLEEIKKAPITANVIDLLVSKIKKLKPVSQETLCVAACIGGTFELKTLATVLEKDPKELAKILLETIEEGLITTSGSDYKSASLGENITYKFLHDKVQEAAYHLVAIDVKPIHLKIADHLLSRNFPLFEVIDQYNRSLDLITDQKQKKEVAQLNYQAAMKTKQSNAYLASLNCLQAARKLIGVSDFETEREYGEALFLNGNFEEAEKHLNNLLKIAPNRLESLRIYTILSIQNLNLGRFDAAIKQAIEGFRLVNMRIPLHPTKFSLMLRYLRFKLILWFKSKKQIEEAPLALDPESLEVDRLVSVVGAASYLSNRHTLYAISIFETILFGLRHGIGPGTVMGFGGYIVALMNFQDFKEAQFWQKITLKYVEKFNSTLLNGRIHFLYATFYAPKFMPLRDSLPLFAKAIKYCIEAGDFVYLGYCYVIRALLYPYMNKTLDRVFDDFEEAKLIFKRTREEGFYDAMVVNQAIFRSLQDPKQNIPEESIQFVFDHPTNRFSQRDLCLNYALLHLIKANYKEALSYIYKSRAYTSPNDFGLYLDTLTMIRNYAEISPKDKKGIGKALKTYQTLSKQNPKNFLAPCLHLSAEIALLEGRVVEAESLFNRALNAAEDEEFYLISALIAESAFQHFYQTDQMRLAKFYFQISFYHYEQWGADEKVRLMGQKIPAWVPVTGVATVTKTTVSSTTGNQSIDLITVMKASQTLSSEIILENLLDKMVRIVMENAGAQAVKILIEHGAQLHLEAEGNQNGEVKIYQDYPVPVEMLPLSIVNYVLRSKQTVVLVDASKNAGHYDQDPYLKKNTIKSLLCTPIMHQSKAIGVLYLENNLSPHIFTEERAKLLHLLASQAAISLENARLYTACDRFVPTQFLNVLGKRSLVDVKLGDQVPCMMTSMVCDIRNFTTLSEKLSSEETFSVLNNFLGIMEPIIRVHHGFIDKYIGDAIMALFSKDPEDALHASIDMLQHQPDGIRIGIGLNTGELILGILGGKDRIDGSVIGDSVNIAFRVQDLTKDYKTPLLITENTKQQLRHPSDFILRLVDEVFVKGKTKPISIWEVCDADPPAIKAAKLKSLDLFAQARQAFVHKEWEMAKKLFQNCLDQNPEDQVVTQYLTKCKIMGI